MTEQEFKTAAGNTFKDIELSLVNTFKMRTTQDFDRHWASSPEGHEFTESLMNYCDFMERLKREGIADE